MTVREQSNPVRARRLVLPVMPANAGIHDFLWRDKGKSWIPAFAGMTGRTGAPQVAYSIHFRMV